MVLEICSTRDLYFGFFVVEAEVNLVGAEIPFSS
jgi:hypothetical protein